MKKLGTICALLLVAALMLTGCDSSDYKKATELYRNGSYSEAAAMFEALGDYSDSREMYLQCKYSEASAAYDDGNYAEALEIFSMLGDYADTADRILPCKYAQAAEAFDEYRYDDAIAILTQITDYAGSKELLAECYFKRSDDAVGEGDYSTAVALLHECQAVCEDTARIQEAFYELVVRYLETNGTMLTSEMISQDIGIAITRKNDKGYIAYIAVDSEDDYALRFGCLADEGVFKDFALHIAPDNDNVRINTRAGFALIGASWIERGEGFVAKSQMCADYPVIYITFFQEITVENGPTKTFDRVGEKSMLYVDTTGNSPAVTGMVEGVCQLLKEIDSTLTPADLGFTGME